jgi:hypothetical protein
MPRFKHYDYNQTKMLPISFDRQILPGSFEYTLDYLVEHELSAPEHLDTAAGQHVDNGELRIFVPSL